MPKRDYPRYQEGGEMPSDIKRLLLGSTRVSEFPLGGGMPSDIKRLLRGIARLPGAIGGLPGAIGGLWEDYKEGMSADEGMSPRDRLILQEGLQGDAAAEENARRLEERLSPRTDRTNRQLLEWAEETGGLNPRRERLQQRPSWQLASGGPVGYSNGGQTPDLDDLIRILDQAQESGGHTRPLRDLLDARPFDDSTIDAIEDLIYDPFEGGYSTLSPGDVELLDELRHSLEGMDYSEGLGEGRGFRTGRFAPGTMRGRALDLWRPLRKGIRSIPLSVGALGPLGDLFELGATPVDVGGGRDYVRDRIAQSRSSAASVLPELIRRRNARREASGRYRGTQFEQLEDLLPYTGPRLPIGRASGGVIGFQGGGAPAQQRSVQSYVSPEVAEPYANLVGRIGEVGAQPYTPYEGQRLAATTPEQAAARAAYYQYGTGAGPTGTRQAAKTYGDVASQFAQTAQTAAAPAMSKGADLEAYKSQYTQGAIDPQLRQIEQQAQTQMSELGSRAGAAGAFGGYRHGIQEGQIAGGAAQRAADVTAKGHQQAFQDAVTRFESDRAAQQAGTGQQMQALTGIANIGTAQAAVGRDEQRQQLERLQGMEQAAARTQQEQQRDYDIAYQDFQRQERHPQERAEWELSAMSQLPYQNTQVISDHFQEPSTASNILGAVGAHEEYKAEQTAEGDTTAETPDMFEGDPPPGGEEDPISGEVIYDSDTTGGEEVGGNPVVDVRGGGYIGSSGILAPYHKKLIDGLYAGGRVSY